METELLESDSEDELPPGWEERANSYGEIFYVNHVSKETQWYHPRTRQRKTLPRDLPLGWRKTVNADGGVVYRDEIRGIESYTDPRLALSIEQSATANDIRYKYDEYSTAFGVLHGINLSNKVAVVTGANSGVGYETARSLAFHGCCVIFACRKLNEAEAAAKAVKEERSFARCVPMHLDLSSLRSVKRFVSEFRSQFKQLNMLILNAAVFFCPFVKTEDECELTFQTCHLGHFYLTTLLEDVIGASVPARVIIVSCESHRFSNLTIENIEDVIQPLNSTKYRKLLAYNNAKLCNFLFANELHTRWTKHGVQIFVAHPGNFLYTNLLRNCGWLLKLFCFLSKPFTKSMQQAASTVVFCATSYSLRGISGVYVSNCRPCPPSDKAKNSNLARHLWTLSEKIIEKAKKTQ